MQRDHTATPGTPPPAPSPVAPLPDIAEHEPVMEPKRAKKLYFIIGIAVAVLLVGYVIYALITAGKETTDDAQVAADVVPVAARIAGQVINVYIHENQQVHRGDVLAEVDPSDARVKVAQRRGSRDGAGTAADADARVAIARAIAQGGYTAAQAGVQSSKEAADTTAAGITEAQAAVTRAQANAERRGSISRALRS
jgi:membrane fusion protein (multidrug efflux system)